MVSCLWSSAKKRRWSGMRDASAQTAAASAKVSVCALLPMMHLPMRQATNLPKKPYWMRRIQSARCAVLPKAVQHRWQQRQAVLCCLPKMIRLLQLKRNARSSFCKKLMPMYVPKTRRLNRQLLRFRLKRKLCRLSVKTVNVWQISVRLFSCA